MGRFIIAIFVIVLLIYTPACAEITINLASGGEIVGDVAINDEIPTNPQNTIIAYHNCDSLGNLTKYTGSAVVTFDAGILLNETDQEVGTGCWDNNNDPYDKVNIPYEGNFDFESGRIGFFWNQQEDEGTRIITCGNFSCSRKDDNEIYINFGSGNSSVPLPRSTGTAIFIEFEFNGTTVDTHVDGVDMNDTVTGIGIGSPVSVTLFSPPGYGAWDSLIDQVISTNDPEESLYALRNQTDFS